MKKSMDKVVHFEIPADDLDRAKMFYASTFGWGLQDVPEMSYVMAQTSESDEKGMPKVLGTINGGMAKRGGNLMVPSFSINVESIDASIEKIKAAGGSVVKEKTAIGAMGFMAYFKDSEGNVLSLWQNAPAA